MPVSKPEYEAMLEEKAPSNGRRQVTAANLRELLVSLFDSTVFPDELDEAVAQLTGPLAARLAQLEEAIAILGDGGQLTAPEIVTSASIDPAVPVIGEDLVVTEPVFAGLQPISVSRSITIDGTDVSEHLVDLTLSGSVVEPGLLVLEWTATGAGGRVTVERLEVFIGDKVEIVTPAAFDPAAPTAGQTVELQPPEVSGSAPISVELDPELAEDAVTLGGEPIAPYVLNARTYVDIPASAADRTLSATWRATGPGAENSVTSTVNAVIEAAAASDTPTIVEASNIELSRDIAAAPAKAILLVVADITPVGSNIHTNNIWRADKHGTSDLTLTGNGTPIARCAYKTELSTSSAISSGTEIAADTNSAIVYAAEVGGNQRLWNATSGSAMALRDTDDMSDSTELPTFGTTMTLFRNNRTVRTSGIAIFALDALPAGFSPSELFDENRRCKSRADMAAYLGAEPIWSIIGLNADQLAAGEAEGTETGAVTITPGTDGAFTTIPEGSAGGGGTAPPPDPDPEPEPGAFTTMSTVEAEPLKPRPRIEISPPNNDEVTTVNLEAGTGTYDVPVESLVVGEDMTYEVVSGPGTFPDASQGFLRVDTTTSASTVFRATNAHGTSQNLTIATNVVASPSPAVIQFQTFGDLRITYPGNGDAVLTAVDPIVKGYPRPTPISREGQILDFITNEVISTFAFDADRQAILPADGKKRVRIITTWSNGNGTDRTHTRTNVIEEDKADWSLADLTVEQIVWDDVVPAAASWRLEAPSRILQELQCDWTFSRGGDWISLKDWNPWKANGREGSKGKQVARVIYGTEDFDWSVDVYLRGEKRTLTGTVTGLVDPATVYDNTNTYYVSQNSDFPPGATNTFTDPVAAADAIPHYSGRCRLLFHRGDVYQVGNDGIDLGSMSALEIDSYGTGANPARFEDAATSSGAGAVIKAINTQLFRIGEVDVQGTHSHLLGERTGPAPRDGVSYKNNTQPRNLAKVIAWGLRASGFKSGLIIGGEVGNKEFVNNSLTMNYENRTNTAFTLVENLRGINPDWHDNNDYLYFGQSDYWFAGGISCYCHPESMGGGQGKDGPLGDFMPNTHANIRNVSCTYGAVDTLEGLIRVGWTMVEGFPAHQTILRMMASGSDTGGETSVTQVFAETGNLGVIIGASSANAVGRWGAHYLAHFVMAGNHNTKGFIAHAASGIDVRNGLLIRSAAESDNLGTRSYFGEPEFTQSMDKEDGDYGSRANRLHDITIVDLHPEAAKRSGVLNDSTNSQKVWTLHDVVFYAPEQGDTDYAPFVKQKIRDHLSPGVKYIEHNGGNLDTFYASPPDEIAYYAPEAGSASSALRAPDDALTASVFDLFGNLRSDAPEPFVGALSPVTVGAQIGPVATPLT